MHGRGTAFTTITIGLAVWLGLTALSFSQFGIGPTPTNEGLPPAAMIVPPGRETLQALHHAREALKQGRTADGIQLLQRLIELPEDYFTDSSMRETLKSETLRILAGLSPSERESYELLRGKPAAALLAEAQAAGDASQLADVARRFPLTAAGTEAAEMLAMSSLDQGHPWQAAVQLSQLRRSPIISPAQAEQLSIREALAWQAAGQTERAAELLWELMSQMPNLKVEIGDRPLPKFKDARHAAQWLAQIGPPGARTLAARESTDWLTPRGNSAGAVRVATTGPIGGPAWRVDPLELVADELPAKGGIDAAARLEEELNRAEAPLRDAEQLLWTTAPPLVVGDVIVFRTVRDLAALDRQTGAVRWRSVLTDPDFDTLWSAEPTRQERINLPLYSPVADYLGERLYEDRTFGSLSSDGGFVFALEGLGFASTAASQNAMRAAMQGGESPWGASNRLTAYELNGGRLAWEIGGDRAQTAGEFASHFFLGPPISADGQLLVLAEVQGELRLVMLEANDRGVKKIWSQPLAAPSFKITEQDDRRRQGLMPATAEGIVICPTGAGVTIAVDLIQRRLLWAYTYPSTSATAGNQKAFGAIMARPNMPAAPQTDDTGWQDATPVIAGGRVFLTPPDSDELHCVQLADGTPLWRIPRSGAAYLAGADAERAVTIAPGRIEAVEAASGEPAWKLPTQVPAVTGRGVWLGDRYLVPLSTGEIASIDLASGRILARSKLPDGRLPGHLAAGSGALVSVSARDVLSFRSQREIEKVLAERLAADPADAAALALRGEDRLHRGERDAGLADLRAAVAKQPDRYMKSVLASALLEGLRNDFAGHRDAVAELDTLTDDPGQRQEYLWLVARGLRGSGDRRAAFDRMLPLVEKSPDELMADGVGSPWTARTDRRLAGHFSALYLDATADERLEFDRLIASRLPAAETPKDEQIAAYRRFLRSFGFHPAANSARQKLAAQLDSDAQAIESAWLLSELADHPDAAVAAPATGLLAKWHLARKRFDDVTSLITTLESRFADAECEPGVTGRQFAARLREDPGYVEHGKEYIPWPAGQVVSERNNQPNHSGRMIRAAIVGQAPVHYQGWSFETDPQGTMLVARDQLARYRWRIVRTAARGQPQHGEVSPGLNRVHLFDHLIGWSAGMDFLVAADLEPEHATPKVLWQDTLLPPGTDPAEFANRFVNIQGRGLARRRVMFNPVPMRGGGMRGAGELVGITRSGVVYHNGRKLIAAEPLTGKLLWSRNDFPTGNYLLSTADDRLVSLRETTATGNESRPAIRRFRALDGELLPSVASPSGVLEYLGSRVLRHNPTRTAEAPKPLELYDLERGEPVWQADLAPSARIRPWNQTDIYTFEENRRLTLRNLADGAIRWTQDIEVAVPVGVVYAQRWKDRVLIVLGDLNPAPATPGSARALAIDNLHITMCGYVAALDYATGKILWQTPINDLPTDPTAIDPWQPAGWPVLAFVAKQIVTPEAGANTPIVPRLTATLIDKETGKLIYGIEEPSNFGTYFVEADPDRNRLTANFMTFSVELHYTGKK